MAPIPVAPTLTAVPSSIFWPRRSGIDQIFRRRRFASCRRDEPASGLNNRTGDRTARREQARGQHLDVAPCEIGIERRIARLKHELYFVPACLGRLSRQRVERDVLIVAVERELHWAMLRNRAVEGERDLRARASEPGAPPRQYLRELTQHDLRDFRASKRVRLVADDREPHKRHVGGARIELDVAVPQTACVGAMPASEPGVTSSMLVEGPWWSQRASFTGGNAVGRLDTGWRPAAMGRAPGRGALRRRARSLRLRLRLFSLFGGHVLSHLQQRMRLAGSADAWTRPGVQR